MKYYLFSTSLICSGCFNPTGSATESETFSIPTTNSTIISVSGNSTSSSNTTDVIPHTTSNTFGSSTNTTDIATTSATSQSSATSTSSTTVSDPTDGQTCGNCQLDPDEDCDYCQGPGTFVPNLQKIGCTNQCTFDWDYNEYNLSIYCGLDDGLNYCGGIGCDMCEGNFACNVMLKRYAIKVLGYDPETLYIHVNGFTDMNTNMPIPLGTQLSSVKGDDSYNLIEYYSGDDLYLGNIWYSETPSFINGYFLHYINCTINP